MTATATSKQLSPAWILFVLTGLNLFNYLDRFVLSAVLTPLQKDLGINDDQAGRLVTAFMIGYFFTSPIFGWLGDRCSRKWLIAAGIFVWSVGTILTGFAATFAMMIAFRMLVGLGEASYATISPSLISDSYAPAKRNNALTIFYVAIPVGAALGTILGGLIAAKWGWRHAFIWTGVPGLFLALVMLPFAELKRGQAEGKTVEAAKRPSVRDITHLFRIPEYVLVVSGYTAYTFALGAFGLWGPTFLYRAHGVAVDKAAEFFGVVLVVAGLMGTMIGGFAATAWQKRNRAGYAWTLGLSVLVAVPLAFGAFLTSSTFWSMAFLAGAMFFLFLSTGPVNTLILESAPVNLRASAMAVSIFTIHLFGDMWSPEIVGRLADSFDGNLRKAVLILPVALIVASALWLVLAVKTKHGTANNFTPA
ncbi:MAG TPA: MFS transporter [Verrucomicrobiae bacterium]|jgi:MFS family permease|nr:MFS transporter [Verrucomicrobiae bacterium]